MNKILGWIVSMTKVGKVAEPVQKFFSGKKSYLAGLSIAIPALATIISNFADQGVAYLIGVANTPEFALLMNGIGVMGIRAAITKAANPTKDPNVSEAK